MNLRNTIPFLIAVFLVAITGTFLALQLFGGNRPADSQQAVQIVTVIVTATPNPNVTPPVIIVTATSDRTQVPVPNDVVPAGITVIPPTGELGATPLDAQAIASGTPSLALPTNCITHTIAAGDTPFGIAAQYGTDGFLILQANGLTEETATLLQIGQVLIVPLEGCPLDQLPNANAQTVTSNTLGGTDATIATPATDATPSGEATSDADANQGPTATLTLAPTASTAQVAIVGIEKAGDVTAEGIRIRNTGNTINVTGWTLSDAQGNTFTFGEQLIFSNQEITVYTRTGQNTPIALYWGRDTAVWGDTGDIATLRDARGNVQANVRLASLGN